MTPGEPQNVSWATPQCCPEDAPLRAAATSDNNGALMAAMVTANVPIDGAAPAALFCHSLITTNSSGTATVFTPTDITVRRYWNVSVPAIWKC